MDNSLIPNSQKEKILSSYSNQLNAFFSGNGGFKNSKKYLRLLFITAFTDELTVLKQDVLALRSLQNSLKKLLEAAYEAFTTKSFDILSTPPDPFSNGHLRQEIYWDENNESLSAFECYPRHLNKKELFHPSLVLEKFFQYKGLPEWKEIFEELLSASLYHETLIRYADIIDNVIQIYDYCFKFLESAHIIKIRLATQRTGASD